MALVVVPPLTTHLDPFYPSRENLNAKAPKYHCPFRYLSPVVK
jgi:hypothetical protein